MRSEASSHPDLLEHLALEFVAQGWSTKWLHRRLMTSATYQHSSRDRESGLARDLDNHWGHYVHALLMSNDFAFVD